MARRKCGRCTSKEKPAARRQRLVTLDEVLLLPLRAPVCCAAPLPAPWLRREIVAEAYDLCGEISKFQSPFFRRGVANLSPSELILHLECQVSPRGRGDEEANGDRVFCHFIDGRGVLRR